MLVMLLLEKLRLLLIFSICYFIQPLLSLPMLTPLILPLWHQWSLKKYSSALEKGETLLVEDIRPSTSPPSGSGRWGSNSVRRHGKGRLHAKTQEGLEPWRYYRERLLKWANVVVVVVVAGIPRSEQCKLMTNVYLTYVLFVRALLPTLCCSA